MPTADVDPAESQLSRGRVYERHLDHEHHLRRNSILAMTLALIGLIGFAIVPTRAAAQTSAPDRSIRASALAPSIPKLLLTLALYSLGNLIICFLVLDADVRYWLSLPKTRFERIDGIIRQGLDMRLCPRTARSGACREHPPPARREFAPRCSS